jgi:hypothetical protein
VINDDRVHKAATDGFQESLILGPSLGAESGDVVVDENVNNGPASLRRKLSALRDLASHSEALTAGIIADPRVDTRRPNRLHPRTVDPSDGMSLAVVRRWWVSSGRGGPEARDDRWRPDSSSLIGEISRCSVSSLGRSELVSAASALQRVSEELLGTSSRKEIARTLYPRDDENESAADGGATAS